MILSVYNAVSPRLPHSNFWIGTAVLVWLASLTQTVVLPTSPMSSTEKSIYRTDIIRTRCKRSHLPPPPSAAKEKMASFLKLRRHRVPCTQTARLSQTLMVMHTPHTYQNSVKSMQTSRSGFKFKDAYLGFPPETLDPLKHRIPLNSKHVVLLVSHTLTIIDVMASKYLPPCIMFFVPSSFTVKVDIFIT